MIKIKKYQIEDYISDATQDALDLKADLVDGKVPASQLPSFVDDVIEVANYAALPIPGASGVIYITLDTNKVYRWSGSVYVEIASGVTNLSYTPGVSNGTVNSDTGSDATIPLAGTVNAGLFSAAEKSKLEGIAPNANVGVIPNAPITGATKTKITYDSKGLVTAGADATTADIADSTNKRYVTDANLTVINNTSGTNTGDQGLQSVTDIGASTTNPITITVGDGVGNGLSSTSLQGYGVYGSSSEAPGVYGTSTSGAGVYGMSDIYGIYGSSTNVAVYGEGFYGIYGNSFNGTAVYGTSDNGIGIFGTSEYNAGISAYSNSIGLEVNGNGTIAIEANLGNSNKGLVINSGTSSTGNFIELNKNGVNKLTVNQAGDVIANSFIKLGSSPDEILAGDGSVIVAGNNINISDGIISSTGGTGGGGIPHATASGTDTYAATITGVTSYIDGDAYLIRFTIGNTTVCTLNINGLGAIPLYRNNDGALIGGDVQSNGEMLCVYNSIANTFQCIGTSPNSIISYVTNADSVTITKGQVVYAFGGTGDRMTVKLASNVGDSTSAQTVGIVLSASIVANQKGFIIFQGLLDNLSILPTATWADGDPVYLGATAGSITKVKPYAPNHLVYIGIVTTASNGSAGRMYVRVQNGYELDELHNVQAQTPTLKDTLWYDNTVSPAQWKTASISTILGYTPANDASVVHLTGNETIAGAKTFTGATVINGNSTSEALTINADSTIGKTALVINTFENGAANALEVKYTNNDPITSLSAKIDAIGEATFWGATLTSQVPSTIAGFDANKKVVSLLTSTYPNLNELSYVKNVTSAIQTQLDSKQNKSLSAYTVMANNTNATADATSQVYKDVGQQTYTATPTWSTSAPTTILANTYEWTQIGSTVNVRISLSYNTGAVNSSVILPMPADMPVPSSITGFTGNSDIIAYGSGMMLNATTSTAVTGARNCLLRRNTSGGYEFFVNVSVTVTTKVVIVNLTYFA